MSVSGLYESDAGDRMARASLVHTHPIKICDAITAVHSKRRCACGGFLNRVPKYRHGKYVCDMCAAKIEPWHGGRVQKMKCFLCDETTPRRSLVIRHGKFYCKACAGKIK